MNPLLLMIGLACLAGSDEKKLRKVECPVDGTTFRAYEVVATNQWGGRDYDFCPHAYKTTPLEFRVWVCPGCGFAGKKRDFEAEIPEAERKRLRKGLKPQVALRPGMKQDALPGHVKFDLLAQVARLRGRPPDEEGRAYLHASWSCRQQGAVYLRGFDEWETLRKRSGLAVKPLQLGKKNRTDLELKVAQRLADDVRAGKVFGVNKILAPYLAAYLYRKHGENAEALRWLGELDKVKGQNSVVDDAVKKMRESIDMERLFQQLARVAYQESLEKGGMEARAAAEITYVVAELYRRTGENEKAVTWYAKTLESPGLTPALRDLATTQRAKLQ